MFASNRLLDYEDLTPKIVDTPLTLIFRMGQEDCRHYYKLGRLPIPRLWMAQTNRHICYTRCTAKDRWHSFSKWCSGHVVHCFGKEGWHYVGYGEQRPGYFSITVLTRLKIVDTWMTLVFKMAQGARGYYFWLERQPIPRLWMVATDLHFGYPRCTAKIIDAPLTLIFRMQWPCGSLFCQERLPVC